MNGYVLGSLIALARQRPLWARSVNLPRGKHSIHHCSTMSESTRRFGTRNDVKAQQPFIKSPLVAAPVANEPQPPPTSINALGFFCHRLGATGKQMDTTKGSYSRLALDALIRYGKIALQVPTTRCSSASFAIRGLIEWSFQSSGFTGVLSAFDNAGSS
jgi:hypothetical protein